MSQTVPDLPPAAAVRIGTAGWNVPRGQASAFPREGSHLERYASTLNAAEINTSFYRPHRKTTYQRWAAAVPDGFRFAVKVPKAITHTARLRDVGPLLDRFLAEVAGLGPTLGPLLVQLPPSLPFEPGVSDAFFEDLRARVEGAIACEPRHVTWFTPDVDDRLDGLRVARVAADPPPVAGAGAAGGWHGLIYHRLHGSPTMYVSAYDEVSIRAVTERLVSEVAQGREGWCIFDNTAASAALPNALMARAIAGLEHPVDGCSLPQGR